MHILRRGLAVAAVAAAMLTGLVIARTATPARGSTQTLVYVCAQTPCTNAQEFEVFDGYGNPIFSVGEYGGAAVFGDNLKVFAPNTVYHPAITQSWESPAAYDRTFRLPASCVAPAVWIEPRGIWSCVTGRWVIRLRL